MKPIKYIFAAYKTQVSEDNVLPGNLKEETYTTHRREFCAIIMLVVRNILLGEVISIH